MIIKDIYSDEEKKAILKAVHKFKDQVVPLTEITFAAKIPNNRGRFIMDILVHEGYVDKICMVDKNPRYRRYTYRVAKEL